MYEKKLHRIYEKDTGVHVEIVTYGNVWCIQFKRTSNYRIKKKTIRKLFN